MSLGRTPNMAPMNSLRANLFRAVHARHAHVFACQMMRPTSELPRHTLCGYSGVPENSETSLREDDGALEKNLT